MELADLYEKYADPLKPNSGVNPATLTLDEYETIINHTCKYHESHAYNYGLDSFNRYHKSEYPTLIQRVKLNGIYFEFRLGHHEYGPVVKHETIGVFDGDQCVGAYQDEWNTVLIMVAKEYRKFGIAPILTKMVRTRLHPEKTSGGFTDAGRRNFVKTYREIVRDALKQGFYVNAVKTGKMSVARAKAILASAKLDIKPKTSNRDLSNNPEDWMLYVGEYGDFILYNKKLKDLISEGDMYGENHFWIEKFMLGTALVRELDHWEEPIGLLFAFGGNSDKIKTLMMTCAMVYAKQENITLYVDQDDMQYVNPKFGKLGKVDLKTGYKRAPVKIIETPDLTALGNIERRFRKSFDKYGEFRDTIQELAHGQFKHEPTK